MTTQGPTVGGLPQPPPGAVGWWQASDTRWYPPQSRPPAPQPVPPSRKNGLATAALVVGIVGIVLGYLGILLGPVAIGLGVVGHRRTTEDPTLPGRTMAFVGSVLGGVAIVNGVVSVILWLWVWDSWWDNAGDDVFNALDETAQELNEVPQELDEVSPPSALVPHVVFSVDCVPGDDGVTHVEGRLTNTGDESRSFDIKIEVGSTDGPHAFPTANIDDVAPGETAAWETEPVPIELPTLDPNVGVGPQPTCELVEMNEHPTAP